MSAVQLYREAHQHRLMHESVEEGVLRELTMDVYTSGIIEWDSNADMGESVYYIDTKLAGTPALDDRLGHYVIVKVDDRNFVNYWADDNKQKMDELWIEMSLPFVEETEDDD